MLLPRFCIKQMGVVNNVVFLRLSSESLITRHIWKFITKFLLLWAARIQLKIQLHYVLIAIVKRIMDNGTEFS